MHRRHVRPNMEDKTDLKFRHVLYPAGFGIVLVIICGGFLAEFAPPMLLSMVIAVLVSPLIGKLTKTKIGWDYSFGVAAACIPNGLLWLGGPSFFNTILPFFLWTWFSISWSKLNLPPFRYGLWHGYALAFSILPGAMLYSKLF